MESTGATVDPVTTTTPTTSTPSTAMTTTLPPQDAISTAVATAASSGSDIVIDLGATQLRVGFVGEDVPRHIMRAVVGRRGAVAVCGNDLLPLNSAPTLGHDDTLYFPARGGLLDTPALTLLLQHALARLAAPAPRVLVVDSMAPTVSSRLSRRLRVAEVHTLSSPPASLLR